MKKQKKQKGKKKSRNKFNWKDLPISRKYITIFLVTAVLFVLAGTMVYSQLYKAEEDIDVIEQRSLRVNEMAQLASIVQAKDVDIADYIITTNASYIDKFQHRQDQFDETMAALDPLMETKDQKEVFSQIKENDVQINDMFMNEITTAVENDQMNEALTLRDESSTLRLNNVNLINQLTNMVNEEQTASVQNAKDSLNNSIVILAIAILVAIGIGISFMLIVSRKIATNLKNVVTLTREVADGNLDVESVEYNGNDEIGQLSVATNKMKNNIHSIIQNITKASELVSAKSDALSKSANNVKEGNIQVASTMDELSSGSETQANSATTLSENMNDFVQRVRQSEQNGEEVASYSNQIQTLTNEGTALMEKSVNQMERIDMIVTDSVKKVQGLEKQSNDITKLVLVIKDIADQTNLLALNAAIEAARAGEHGKGFAVVAEEVRKLSEQVADSITEITNIVTSIQTETDHVVDSLNSGYEEVKEGTEQIKTTRGNFETIHNSVSDMTENISAISKTLSDIAQNSTVMNNTIEEIASVSEESATSVEQVAASAQQTAGSMDDVYDSASELAKLADKLNDELKVFNV
ncbi:methyl-accepting chemotaxis protein [Oceanobacillus halotolerans]|uniref:methyl-accepting chemotaxis protein n=1 Tax=Oceanobacillus halotolerans TaxID=2663380 RepID=UPI0013DBA96C|nr:methyl-accepting chemotaxis protein [Oceanobacillus halotolerans]